MPPRRHDLGGSSFLVDRRARHLDARRRLQRDADENVLAARDAAERAARRVLLEAVGRQLVAMLAAALTHALESLAELDALDRVDAHHRFRDLAIELVEDGLAEPHGNARRDHVD